MALMESVLALEEKQGDERKEAFLELLEKGGYEYEIEKSESGGINVILQTGRGMKQILLVCNYDSHPDSPGANNNASSVAVAINVYKRLVEYKDKGLLNGRVKVVFFGNEDSSSNTSTGKSGSQEYVQKHEDDFNGVVSVINLKLCGSGDMIAIWPVGNVESKEKGVLPLIEKVLDRMQLDHMNVSRINAFSGCYEEFIRKGVKETFCLTAIDSQEKDNFKAYSESMALEIGVRNLAGIFFKKMRVQIPDIFSRYKSTEDKSSYIKESSLRMMSDATFNSIVNLDRKFSNKIEKF